jgi:hypothetical protein
MRNVILLFTFCLLATYNFAQKESGFIHFNSKKTIQYFKKNECIVGRIDPAFNLWLTRNGTSHEIALKQVHSNFASDTVELLFLKYQIDSSLSLFIQQNPSFHYYFKPNKANGSYKLIGYSENAIQFPKNKVRPEKIELIDFTNLSDTLIKQGEYVIGGIDINLKDIYPLLYQSGIILYYPMDLKLKEMELYGSYYQLDQPLSIAMIHAINNSVQHQIVLKKINETYQIVGYINP